MGGESELPVTPTEPCGFVHLHNHSEYSLLDGANRIRDLVAAAQGCGMPALALTDHGAMHGAVEFYKEAKRRGVTLVLEPTPQVVERVNQVSPTL